MRHLSTTSLYYLLKGAMLVKRALLFVVIRWIGAFLKPVWRILLRYALVPLYSWYLRGKRVARATRGALHGAVGVRGERAHLAWEACVVFVLILVLGEGSALAAGRPGGAVPLLALVPPLDEVGELPEELIADAPEETFVGTVVGGRSIAQPTVIPGALGPGERRSVIAYVVQRGDTVASVASRYGVSPSTVLWENKLTMRSVIRPGDTLRILPVSGVSHTVRKGDTVRTIAKKYGVKEKELIAFNGLGEGGALSLGQTVVVPGGEPPPPPRSRPRLVVRTPTPLAAPIETGGALLWPAAARRITQYFGRRHSGVDIAGPRGTPLYAADAGAVTHAGWARGYGLRIIVDHGNGLHTLYGHASELLVLPGQYVDRGTVVARMGSTGRSTGNHLHFEVIEHGRRVNPFRYLR